MVNYPKKDPDAKTGSNIPGDPILKHRSKLLATRQQLFRKLASDYQREAKKFLTKTDLRVATELHKEVSQQWRKASVTVRGDSTKVDALKASARRKLDKSLRKSLTNYGKLQSLKRDHARDFHKLAKTVMAGSPGDQVHVDWGNVLPTANPDVHEFTFPFQLFAQHTLGDDEIFTRDESFVSPNSGTLVHNITADVEDDTLAVVGIPGFYLAITSASCGVPFTMPRAGRLHVGALMQNFYNQVTLSLRDRFGFSSGEVSVILKLFIDIARPGSVIHLRTDLLSPGLVSQGSDLSYTMSDLDISTPYTFSMRTEEVLPVGEPTMIFAGAEITFLIELDDMQTHIETILWWQLKKMTVEVVD